MAGNRLLLIDDDTHLTQALAQQLERQGHTVVTEATAICGMERALGEPFDAIILDIGLPDGDGRDVCCSLRRKGLNTPIIMLTGADSEEDTIQGLDAGANDYISKPFKFSLLLARLSAQIRHHQQYDDVTLIFGPYMFRPADKLLTDCDGRRIRLTDKEVAILKYLYRHGGVVSREELLDAVWGYGAEITTHTLETHIYRLRQKIEPSDKHAKLLTTEPGGYRLECTAGTVRPT